MNRAFQLSRLQHVDTHLDRAHARLKEIAAILSEDADVRQAEAALQQASQKLEDCKKALRKADEDTKAQRAKIEVTDAELYGGKVRNPKELQDLQRESEALRRYLEVLEERQLEVMLAVDELETARAQAQRQLDELMARRIQAHAALNGEKSALMKEIETLRAERQAALNPISAEDLAHYEALRKRRAGIAVATVRDRSCSACGTQLSTSQFQAALSLQELIHCDTCGRILYAG